jgi:hypothetical protein
MTVAAGCRQKQWLRSPAYVTGFANQELRPAELLSVMSRIGISTKSSFSYSFARVHVKPLALAVCWYGMPRAI